MHLSQHTVQAIPFVHGPWESCSPLKVLGIATIGGAGTLYVSLRSPFYTVQATISITQVPSMFRLGGALAQRPDLAGMACGTG